MSVGRHQCAEQTGRSKKKRSSLWKDIQSTKAMGYKRTRQQCPVKVKNIHVVAQYGKIRDSKRRSGRGRKEFPFHNEMNAVFVGRPASEPSAPLLFEDHMNIIPQRVWPNAK